MQFPPIKKNEPQVSHPPGSGSECLQLPASHADTETSPHKIEIGTGSCVDLCNCNVRGARTEHNYLAPLVCSAEEIVLCWAAEHSSKALVLLDVHG